MALLTFAVVALLPIASVHSLVIENTTPSRVETGDTARIAVQGSVAQAGARAWAFVNETQWASPCSLAATTARCTLLLPLPVSGDARIVVALLTSDPRGPCGPGYPVGAALEANLTVALSNALHLTVASRAFPPRKPVAPVVLMEFEPWFQVPNDRWNNAQGIPILGRYCSFDAKIVRQHSIWFYDTGVDALLVDWTNNLWDTPHWADRGATSQGVINGTTFLLNTYEALAREGTNSTPTPPQVALLLGLDNGPVTPIVAMNEQIEWIVQNYLERLSHARWVVFHEKPLIVVLDSGHEQSKFAPIVAPQFTLRFMSTQLQNNPSWALNDTYYSWMDGTLQPVPATNAQTGAIEAVTVTPAFFQGTGWTGLGASAFNGGGTLVEEMRWARSFVEMRSRWFSGPNTTLHFLIVCQWNEFQGQSNGPPGTIYTDSYNMSLSNDLEPTSLTECAVLRPNQRRSCGGYGFFPLNLFSAALQILRGTDVTSTLVVLTEPLVNATLPSYLLTVRWNMFGAQAASAPVTLRLNDRVIVSNITNTTCYTVSLSQLQSKIGPLPQSNLSVEVRAEEARTLHPLSLDSLDRTLDLPRVPRASTHSLHLSPSSIDLPNVLSAPVGFTDLTSPPPYAYGPTIVLDSPSRTYHMWYCSPGSHGAWDVIRHATSTDGSVWSQPDIALSPGTKYDTSSVCDPSVVLFRGVYYLYHTCINVDSPPDDYRNNRICLALADSPYGPWRHLDKPVLQDLSCPSNASLAYCLGQPSAVTNVDGTQVLLFYSSVFPSDRSAPNPGRVLLARSADGVHFSASSSSTFVLSQRDVDVKRNRRTGDLFLVQGDVGSTDLTWSVSGDEGAHWQPWNASHAIATNPLVNATVAGVSNNNPGLVGLADGSFAGDTFALYGSSYEAKWGAWSLYRSNVTVGEASDCSQCALNSCDFACAPQRGFCAQPGSRDPAKCCVCEPVPPSPSCASCAPNGCVDACVQAGHGAGYCEHPGAKADCCRCV